MEDASSQAAREADILARCRQSLGTEPQVVEEEAVAAEGDAGEAAMEYDEDPDEFGSGFCSCRFPVSCGCGVSSCCCCGGGRS